ncbi:hypothetical protein JCM11251_006822 [Rhodosporidiobolus azoricus]
MTPLPPPRTPTKPRGRASRRASTGRSPSSIAGSPSKPVLVPLSLSSSSPVPRALDLDPASVGAPVKHAHFHRQVDEKAENDEPDSPTEDARKEWRRLSSRGGGRRGMSRSEGQENEPLTSTDVNASSRKQQSRRATFSKVVSSGRTTLIGLGQPQSTGKIGTPPRTGSYIPPHQRRPLVSTPYQPLLSPLRNPLAAFDRSACPEAEDSFYTNVSTLSLGGSPASTAYSTPGSSRLFNLNSPGSAFSAFGGPKPSPLSFAGRSTPFQAAPLSPTTLISRAPYVDPHNNGHPQVIPEEDDEADFVGCSTASPAPVETLDWAEEAALASAEGEAEVADEQIEIQFKMGARRRSSAFVSSPGLPEDAVPDSACSGCGAERNAAFVELLPCHHLLCHVCTNALINGAAHKPPRPTDCFACTNFVETFVPAGPSSTSLNGDMGLVVALKDVLLSERARETGARRRQSIVSTATGASEENESGGIKLSRTRRRRSSMVAAAIAATLLAAHSEESVEQQQQGRSRSSTMSSFNSLASLPSSTAEEESFGGAFIPLKKGDDAHALSRRQSVGEQAPIATSAASQPLAANKLPHFDASSVPVAIDWPVVRLDNLPWEVTVSEIEQWAGEGNLASDLDDFGAMGGKRVTLAVHILCNRADGRTLNQAFLECSSLSTARALVRSQDGSKLRGRPVHVSLTGQSEFLTTLFPTYTPGFSSLEPNPNNSSKYAAPIPLLLQTELTGLLNLCRLESAHARKVPERPYFNLVTLLEKMPWSFPAYYNSQAVVRLLNTVCGAIEILGSIKRSVPAWKGILTVLVDAILNCPVFRPHQKHKAVRIAASIGFDHAERSTQSITSIPSKPLIRDPAAVHTSSFTPSSLKEKFVGTAPDQALLAAKQAEGTFVDDSQLVELGLPSPRFRVERRDEPEDVVQHVHASPTKAGGKTVVSRSISHIRRRSSIAAQLNIDKALVESVAAALGITLAEPASTSAV